MTDVLIPNPGGALVCGPDVLTGQHLVGEATAPDTYLDEPLSLDGGTGQLLTEHNVLIVVPAAPQLDLDGGSATLLIDVVFLILVENSYPLALDGDVAIVNPMLMPEVCDDLDLAALACADLDLTGLTCETLDLDPVVCLEA